MRERNRLMRRRWLVGCGVAAATGLAGCLGGDTEGGDGGDSGGSGSGSGSGDGSGGTDGGDGGSDGGGSDGGEEQPEIRGELVVSETVTEVTEWKYDLEEGDTITAVFEGDLYSTGEIYRGNSVAIMDSANIPGGETDIAQYTAEEPGMYRVVAKVNEEIQIEIYVDRG